MSVEAKSFFADYRGRVGLMAVNGVEVTTFMQAEALCSNTETIVLHFVVSTPAMARRGRVPLFVNAEPTLSQKQIEEAAETPLVNQTHATRIAERKKKPKSAEESTTKDQQQVSLRENAEDLDAAVDVAYTAHANEAEELTAEPERPAEEDDVKETYPAVADEEVAPDAVLGSDEAKTTAATATATVAADAPKPLVMPNNVTIDLLTPTEMVIRRDSTKENWGLKLESSEKGEQKAMRLLSLTKLLPKRDARRSHPFFKLFREPPGKTEWRIQSVNKTPVSRAKDLLDMMRQSLKMHIKFKRR